MCQRDNSPILGWKCQSKARFSMKDEELLTPHGRLQLTPKHHYTQVHWKSCPLYYSNIKNNLKAKTKQDIHRPEILDYGQTQKCGKVKVLWRDHIHSLPSATVEKNITQLNTFENQFRRFGSLVKTEINTLSINYTNEQTKDYF